MVSKDQARRHHTLPAVSVMPASVEVTITSKPTKEVELSARQETQAQTLDPPVDTDAYPSEQEQPVQPSESPGGTEPSGN